MPDGLSRRALLRGVGAGALAALAAPALAACGSETGTPVQSGDVALRFWTHDPGYARTFNAAAANPALTGRQFRYSLQVTKAADADLVSRTIAQAVADGTTPDLLGIVVDQFPRVMGSQIAQNLFVDLTDIVKPLGADLLKQAPFSVDGRVYALESDNSVSVLYYRHDEFQKHGISPDLTTWEEYAEAGAALHKKTGQSLGMVATGDNNSIVNGYLQVLLQRGGALFTADGQLALDTDEALQALTFLVDGLRSGFLIDLPDPYGSACAAALKGGQLIAITMPNWYNVYGLQANVPEQKNQWAIRTLPRFTAGGHIASLLGGTGFTVTRGKSTTDAALALLKAVYLTREGQILRYQTAGYLPTLKHLYSDPELLGVKDAYLGGQQVFEVYGRAATDLPIFQQAPGMLVLTDVLGGPLLDAFKGRMSPAEALRAGASAYREQVKR